MLPSGTVHDSLVSAVQTKVSIHYFHPECPRSIRIIQSEAQWGVPEVRHWLLASRSTCQIQLTPTLHDKLISEFCTRAATREFLRNLWNVPTTQNHSVRNILTLAAALDTVWGYGCWRAHTVIVLLKYNSHQVVADESSYLQVGFRKNGGNSVACRHSRIKYSLLCCWCVCPKTMDVDWIPEVLVVIDMNISGEEV